jgi:hypothetical protein
LQDGKIDKGSVSHSTQTFLIGKYMSLKPSIVQMLNVAQDCGLTTLNEAYSNYMSHYDCFFLLSDYAAQQAVFFAQLKECGFFVAQGNSYTLKEISIVEALDTYKALNKKEQL